MKTASDYIKMTYLKDIIALNEKGDFLKYTTGEELGNFRKTANVFYNPIRQVVSFSFLRDKYIGEQSINNLNNFVANPRAIYAEPLIRVEGESSENKDNHGILTHRTLLNLRDQFGGMEFKVLGAFPFTDQKSGIYGVKIGVTIGQCGNLWGVLGEEDIIPIKELDNFEKIKKGYVI